MSLTAAWAAWAVALIAAAYLPAAQFALNKASTYILHQKHGTPQPVPAAQIHGGGE